MLKLESNLILEAKIQPQKARSIFYPPHSQLYKLKRENSSYFIYFSKQDNVKREEEIKELQETNQKLVDESAEITDSRQTVLEDLNNKLQLCLDNQRKITLLKNNQKDLKNEVRKISSVTRKCVSNHEVVTKELKEKLDLLKKINIMKENIEPLEAENREAVRRKRLDSPINKSKKLILSTLKEKERNDQNQIIDASNELHELRKN